MDILLSGDYLNNPMRNPCYQHSLMLIAAESSGVMKALTVNTYLTLREELQYLTWQDILTGYYSSKTMPQSIKSKIKQPKYNLYAFGKILAAFHIFHRFITKSYLSSFRKTSENLSLPLRISDEPLLEILGKVADFLAFWPLDKSIRSVPAVE